MLKANELRLGNWVLIDKSFVKIESIDEQGINSSVGGGYYPGEYEKDYAAYFGGQSLWSTYDEPKSILLTPEILKSCGFWSHMDGGYYLPEDPNDENNLMPKNGFILDDEYNFHYEDSYSSRSVKIKSVHQLQNMFYSLTGEELQINLNLVKQPSHS